LKEGILDSSEAFLTKLSVPSVVFIFYLISEPSYILFFAKGGNFVDDFEDVSLYWVFIPLEDPENPPGLLLLIRSRVWDSF